MANRPVSTSARLHVAVTAARDESVSALGDDPQLDVAVLRQAGLSVADILPLLDAAMRQGVPVGAVAVAHGAVSAVVLANAMAATLGVRRFDGRLERRRPDEPADVHRTPNGVVVLVAEWSTATAIAARHHALAAGSICLATAAELMAARERQHGRRALRHACVGLRRRRPDLSAATPPATWQRLLTLVLIMAVAGGLVMEPEQTTSVCLALVSLPFLAVIAIRLVAVVEVSRRPLRTDPPALSDAALPTYTVLVPMYGEASLVPDMIKALQRIDYPATKLDLVLVLEACDADTCALARRAAKPANLRLCIVPDGQPRTKPRALAYALQFTSADVVVVYDAEDRPEADQLRKAAALLAAGPPNLGCVQARLDLYNPDDSWFARQFTIEYAALFGAILPALDRLGLPIPLGGTSNHFPRAVLERVGGWDPFNVTEDADLGLRLARFGYAVRMLPSTTWEEAPIAFRQWLPQRTRWLKGWVQTTLVHTRSPRRLLADLGLWRTVGLTVVLWGLLLSAIVHPVPYVVLALWAAGVVAAPVPDATAGLATWVAFTGLGLGYASAMVVGWLAVRRRHPALVRAVWAMPLVWLLISFAAYRALWQYVRAPFLWEKTTHAWRRAKPQFRHDADAATRGQRGESS